MSESLAKLEDKNIFQRLGLPEEPLILAPLAGVSDAPFRRICSLMGADLTYIEMLSATAIVYKNRRTLDMLKRHPTEKILGVQITSRSAEEMYEAVRILEDYPLDTIDINMGCPVKKVVKVGCGSAIMKDLDRVSKTCETAVRASSRPVSAKIRLGWDSSSMNFIEVARRARDAGVQWITLHGRTRADTYAQAVDLFAIQQLVEDLNIPVIGNGNIFSSPDFQRMKQFCKVQTAMVSRGALGNPWVFREIKAGGKIPPLSITEWWDGVLSHLLWQEEEYGISSKSIICMRKHLLWYMKGWQGAKTLKEELGFLEDPLLVRQKFQDFVHTTLQTGGDSIYRIPLHQAPDGTGESKFLWDPKWEMERQESDF